MNKNLADAFEILRKYHRNPVLITEGDYRYVQVLFEELEEVDWEGLKALGWEVIDDYIGFEEKNPFNRFFENWWMQQLKEGYVSMPWAHMDDETVELAKQIAYQAMLEGVGIGSMDSQLTQAALVGPLV